MSPPCDRITGDAALVTVADLAWAAVPPSCVRHVALPVGDNLEHGAERVAEVSDHCFGYLRVLGQASMAAPSFDGFAVQGEDEVERRRGRGRGVVECPPANTVESLWP